MLGRPCCLILVSLAFIWLPRILAAVPSPLPPPHMHALSSYPHVQAQPLSHLQAPPQALRALGSGLQVLQRALRRCVCIWAHYAVCARARGTCTYEQALRHIGAHLSPTHSHRAIQTPVHRVLDFPWKSRSHNRKTRKCGAGRDLPAKGLSEPEFPDSKADFSAKTKPFGSCQGVTCPSAPKPFPREIPRKPSAPARFSRPSGSNVSIKRYVEERDMSLRRIFENEGSGVEGFIDERSEER